MFHSCDNIIDKKFEKTFPQEILNNLKPDILDYFGINISSDPKKDFAFKIYYKNQFSRELYSKSEKIPLIEFLTENNLMNFLTI